MELNDVQEWEKYFYKKRGWIKLPPYIRIGFLMEEVGEVSRAVRTYEIGRDHPGENKLSKQAIKENLAEEMGDVLSNLSILASPIRPDAGRFGSGAPQEVWQPLF